MKTPSLEALQAAIDLAGGITALARLLAVPQSTVGMWKARASVPADYCPSIERVTRKLGRVVRCEALNPSVDWAELRRRVVKTAAVA